MSNYCTYIVRCIDNTLYCGITTDVTRRMRQHNGELVGSAKYTQYRRPVKLVYQAKFEDRSDAQKEEYRIKQLTRLQKEELLKDSDTGSTIDLSEGSYRL